MKFSEVLFFIWIVAVSIVCCIGALTAIFSLINAKDTLSVICGYVGGVALLTTILIIINSAKNYIQKRLKQIKEKEENKTK